MAETYKMGQYRYVPGVCTENLTDIFSAQPLYIPISEGSNSVYQDICLRSSDSSWQQFNENESYYFSMEVPQNLNYDLELVVKMTSCKDPQNYQVIKRILVPRNSQSSITTSRVCLWEKTEAGGDEDPRADIPVVFTREVDDNGNFIETDEGIILKQGVTPAVDMLIYRQGEPYRYISQVNADNTFVTKEVSGYNDVILVHSWDSKVDTEHRASYEFVFSPKVPSSEMTFDAIHIDMIRIPEDSDIIEGEIDISTDLNTPDVKILCGRYINKDALNFRLYKINAILPPENIDKISRIGVWGPSGLLMSINGEPIRVGPSGYYELKNFDITSFGVFVPDEEDAANLYQNNFTVDYQYLVK